MSEFGEFNLPRVARGHEPCCVLDVLASFEMASFHPFPRRFISIISWQLDTQPLPRQNCSGDAGGGASAHPRPGDLEATRAVDHHLGHTHSLTETDGHQVLKEKKFCNRKYNKISEKRGNFRKRKLYFGGWNCSGHWLFQSIKLRILLYVFEHEKISEFHPLLQVNEVLRGKTHFMQKLCLTHNWYPMGYFPTISEEVPPFSLHLNIFPTSLKLRRDRRSCSSCSGEVHRHFSLPAHFGQFAQFGQIAQFGRFG